MLILRKVLNNPAACGNNLLWTYTDGTLTVSGTGDMWDYAYSAPAPWDAYKENITRIVIGEGVTGIGSYAFYNYENLTEVSAPSAMHRIGSWAFYRCSNLTTAVIPSSRITIDNNAFANCSTLTIHGITGSGSESYAKANFIPFVPIEITGCTVTGKITSFGEGQITVELLQNGMVIPSLVPVFADNTYTFSNVPAGTYILRVSKPKHVTRSYTITVGMP